MNKLIFGRYIPGDSFIHRLDPRAKLLASFYFIGIIFLANNWQSYVLIAAFTAFAISLSKIHMPPDFKSRPSPFFRVTTARLIALLLCFCDLGNIVAHNFSICQCFQGF